MRSEAPATPVLSATTNIAGETTATIGHICTAGRVFISSTSL